GAWLRREERSAWRRPALLLVLALAASCLSPFGWRTWAFAHTLAAFLRSVGGAITEFGPPTGAFLRVWTVKLFWVYWAGTLLIALLLLHRRGARPFALLVALAGLGLSAASARNLPLLPLLSAPLHAAFADWASSRRRGLAGWFARRARPTAAALVRRGAPAREGADGADRSPARPRGAGALVACGLTAAAALGLSAWIVNGGFHEALLGETRFGFGLPPHTYPLRFAAYLERHPAPGRVFNNAADGGYLEYRFPGLRVYMDSRYVDAPLVREYFAALVDPQAFARLHARQRFDGALLKIADSPGLVLALLGDPQWRLVYGDPHRAFFVARERAESGDWPVEPPLFFQGDDLARRVNGLPAIQWVGVLARGSDRALLLAALEQLSGAPRIPSYVIQYALQYGFERQDGEVLELASRMYPRMFALDTAGRRFVDALMRRLPSR
ncbi:MAG: hypothetical protein FJY75_12395, partial [Candidatus Eisenbacteria bacterium]|nr:hypothetical protein [Candidatus Eisenbacteria bacterium]